MVGVVVEAGEPTATVDVDGAREAVGVELVAPVAAGDRLLCHAGIALAKVEDGAGVAPAKVEDGP